MIQQLYIKNFKSLKEIDLELRNLNLLTGLNGSGKSSLIQSLLLLRQSPDLNRGELLLRKNEKELFDAGVARDVYYQWGVDKEICFGFKVGSAIELKWCFECDAIKNPEANILYSRDYYKFVYESSVLFGEGFTYLNAERLSPQNFYKRDPQVVENEYSIGTLGEYTAHFLEIFGEKLEIKAPSLQHTFAKSYKLIHQVEAWLSEISPNVNLNVKKISNEETRISYQFGTNRGNTLDFKPKNVGFGLSYVLPVVVALLTANDQKLIIIENPESHIHPRGQAELGKLFAAAAEAGAQLLVETHSDHILNGIRVATREKAIHPDKVVAFYFKRSSEDNCSEITPILIDGNGKLHRKATDGTNAKIPKGFFDEWTNSMAKLF